MQIHAESGAVIYAGCGALRNLSSQHGMGIVCCDCCYANFPLADENRKAISKAGGVDVLLRALSSFIENKSLVYWAAATLSNLARDPSMLYSQAAICL